MIYSHISPPTPLTHSPMNRDKKCINCWHAFSQDCRSCCNCKCCINFCRAIGRVFGGLALMGLLCVGLLFIIIGVVNDGLLIDSLNATEHIILGFVFLIVLTGIIVIMVFLFYWNRTTSTNNNDGGGDGGESDVEMSTESTI